MEDTSSCKKSTTVTYTLFQYREELCRNEKRPLRLAKTKYTLTNELIKRTYSNVKQCKLDDLKTMRRECIFKKELLDKINRIRKLQKKIKSTKPKNLIEES